MTRLARNGFLTLCVTLASATFGNFRRIFRVRVCKPAKSHGKLGCDTALRSPSMLATVEPRLCPDFAGIIGCVGDKTKAPLKSGRGPTGYHYGLDNRPETFLSMGNV